jgi:predicted nucleotidyltransferase
MLLDRLIKQGVVHPPKWLASNLAYMTIMGSQAYGVSVDESDLDIYGFCIPPKEMIFPHLAGIIPGFGDQGTKFENWQEHHVKDPNKTVEYDFSIHSIVKYFDLCMAGNPNMTDSLWTPQNCVIHSTQVSEIVRSNRQLFLSKQMFSKYKGYSYAQRAKIATNVNSSNAKRADDIEKYGYSTKFAYHLIRLMNEIEQILVEHELDLQKNNEQLKSIRRGEWTLERIDEYFQSKEKILEETYSKSTLRQVPDEAAIKEVLMQCLEHHYGDISTAVSRNPEIDVVLRDIQTVLDRYSS